MKFLDVPMSGSMAGETASRNRGGQYFRTRAQPVQPRTASQQQAKARFSDASIAWRALTDNQRAAWNAFAQSFTVMNSLGAASHLTGHQAFVKCGTTAVLLGDSLPTTPPALPSFGANPCTAIEVTYGSQLLAATCGTIPADTSIMVFGAPALSVGRSFCSGWRFLKKFTTATNGKLTVTTEYTAKFGAIVEDKRYFILCVQVMGNMQDQGAVFQGVPAS